MSHKSCWEILGIEPTQDQKNIKRAYARLSRTRHPEDDPEEFRKLHEAYESAMHLAEFLSRQDEHLQQAEARPVERPEARPKERPEERTDSILAAQDPVTELEQLIRRGLERDQATRSERLMEKIRYIHAHTLAAVHSDERVFSEVMDRWEGLFGSSLFQQEYLEENFLTELADWLRDNRGQLNRAEAVCFYRIYGFRTVPDRGTGLWEVYVQIMTAAHKYEKDMVRHAGMPLYMRNYGPVHVEAKRKELKSRVVYALLMIYMVFRIISAVGLSDAASGSAVSTADAEVIKEFHHTFTEGHGDGREKADAFTLVFPDGYPKTKTEISRENDRSQSLWSVCSFQQKLDDSVPDSLVCIQTNSGKHPAVYEVTAIKDAYGQDISRTFYKQTMPNAVITSRFYVERDRLRYGSFKILTDSYLPETFLKIAGTNGIPGAFWVDEDYGMHLILTCDSVERIPELAAALMITCEDFTAYHKYNRLRQPLPSMDLTILYGPSMGKRMIDGPESDPVVAALMTGTYEPSHPVVHRNYSAYYDKQKYELDFRPDEVKATSSDADPAGSDYWVSHIVFAPAWDVGIHLYPECSYQTVLHRLIDSLESLDWVVSRND